MKSLLPLDWRARRGFPPRSPRFEVSGSRGDWHLYDWAYATQLTFDRRKDADTAARFARQYVKKHGDIDFDSFPYNLSDPLEYEHPDEIAAFWSYEYPAYEEPDADTKESDRDYDWDPEELLRKWRIHADAEGYEVELPPTRHPNPLFWLWRQYSDSDDFITPIRARYYGFAAYAWAIPDDNAIKKIAALGPLLEVGSGSGYWAKLLSDVGADIIATDAYPHAETFFPVEQMSSKTAAEKYGSGRTLLMIWPPYDESMAYDALRAYEDIGGHRVVYVGEGMRGCTADDKFHAALSPPSSDDVGTPRVAYRGWDLKDDFGIPQWDGIHDSVYVYER